jgi:copper(I)-binding protein
MKKTVFAFALIIFGVCVAFAKLQTFGTLHITKAHFRALNGAPNGSAYLTISQTGDVSDYLIGAHCDDACERMEIHDHVTDPVTKVKKMVEIKSIKIPSKKETCGWLTCWFKDTKPVEFVKGGKHLMLMGLKPDANSLKEVYIKLVFKKAGEVTVKFKAIDAEGLLISSTSETKSSGELHKH